MNELSQKLLENLGRVIVGKETVLHNLVSAFLAGGHVLMEDVPGTGKTILARTLAKSIQVQFSRIQFTPDLLPADVTGVSIFNQKEREFEFRPGPVFAQILLADELNRATPRTQSALLEVMAEQTVSVDGITHALAPPFFVIATQNPVEQQGVYDLPEAQLDRFLVRLSLGYPSVAEERRIVTEQRLVHPLEELQPVLQAHQVIDAQKTIREQVNVEQNVLDYMIRLIHATRDHRDLALGCSPRASLALYRYCQASAWVDGENFVSPDRVKRLAGSVIAHRLMIKPQSRIGGITAASVVEEILGTTPVPTTRLQ
ncbi:MAG: AAA family ATPase [Sumerlaeia bacterium]